MRAGCPFDVPAHPRAATTAEPLWLARSSRGCKRDVEELRWCLALLELLGQHAQCQSLHPRHGLIAVSAVAHDTRKGRHLGKPTAVALLLEFDGEGHERNVPSDLLPRDNRLPPVAALAMDGVPPRWSAHGQPSGAFTPGFQRRTRELPESDLGLGPWILGLGSLHWGSRWQSAKRFIG